MADMDSISATSLLTRTASIGWGAKLRRGARSRLISFGIFLYRMLGFTWRVEHLGEPPLADGGPAIYAHWHGDELVLVHAFRRRGIGVMVSHSKDGDVMGGLLRVLGYRVVRGSSSRGGGAGLKGLIDLSRHERAPTAVAVDGPRGPRGVVKPGILKLAESTGRPIIPGAVAARHKFVFQKAWNRCFLPFPFARCLVVYGEPIYVAPGGASGAASPALAKLQRVLHELKAEAEQLVVANPHS